MSQRVIRKYYYPVSIMQQYQTIRIAQSLQAQYTDLLKQIKAWLNDQVQQWNRHDSLIVYQLYCLQQIEQQWLSNLELILLHFKMFPYQLAYDYQQFEQTTRSMIYDLPWIDTPLQGEDIDPVTGVSSGIREVMINGIGQACYFCRLQLRKVVTTLGAGYTVLFLPVYEQCITVINCLFNTIGRCRSHTIQSQFETESQLQPTSELPIWAKDMEILIRQILTLKAKTTGIYCRSLPKDSIYITALSETMKLDREASMQDKILYWHCVLQSSAMSEIYRFFLPFAKTANTISFTDIRDNDTLLDKSSMAEKQMIVTKEIHIHSSFASLMELWKYKADIVIARNASQHGSDCAGDRYAELMDWIDKGLTHAHQSLAVRHEIWKQHRQGDPYASYSFPFFEFSSKLRLSVCLRSMSDICGMIAISRMNEMTSNTQPSVSTLLLECYNMFTRILFMSQSLNRDVNNEIKNHSDWNSKQFRYWLYPNAMIYHVRYNKTSHDDDMLHSYAFRVRMKFLSAIEPTLNGLHLLLAHNKSGISQKSQEINAFLILLKRRCDNYDQAITILASPIIEDDMKIDLLFIQIAMLDLDIRLHPLPPKQPMTADVIEGFTKVQEIYNKFMKIMLASVSTANYCATRKQIEYLAVQWMKLYMINIQLEYAKHWLGKTTAPFTDEEVSKIFIAELNNKVWSSSFNECQSGMPTSQTSNQDGLLEDSEQENPLIGFEDVLIILFDLLGALQSAMIAIPVDIESLYGNKYSNLSRLSELTKWLVLIREAVLHDLESFYYGDQQDHLITIARDGVDKLQPIISKEQVVFEAARSLLVVILCGDDHNSEGRIMHLQRVLQGLVLPFPHQSKTVDLLSQDYPSTMELIRIQLQAWNDDYIDWREERSSKDMMARKHACEVYDTYFSLWNK